MNAAQFNASVCNVTQLIPRHKVTTCAHIAKLLGEPTKARRVSEIIKFLGQASSHLPWHRVVSTSGIIASRVQRRALKLEGVPVFIGSHGESCVEFDRFGWFPDYVLYISVLDSEDEWGS